MARHTLQRLGDVDEVLERRVALVHLLERLRETDRLVKRDVQRAGAGRHLLCNRVRLRVAYGQGAPDVAYRAARGHGAEGHDLRDMIMPVDAVDVVDDLAAAVDAEINVDIRH